MIIMMVKVVLDLADHPRREGEQIQEGFQLSLCVHEVQKTSSDLQIKVDVPRS